MRASLIVAAGGTGERFRQSLAEPDKKKSARPFSHRASSLRTSSKLFLPLREKPLIAHAISAFQGFSEIRETVVAVAPGMEEELRRLIRKFRWRGVRVVRGGKTRAESVWKALGKTNARHEWVLVHDGARPFVSPESIKRLFKSVKGVDGVVLGKEMVPTIKEVSEEMRIRRTVDRRVLCEAQTPQLVRQSVLKRAYQQIPNAFGATDESVLLESVNASVRMVTHRTWNPKITTAQDFELAEAYLERGGREQVRTGFGMDTHRLVPGRKFYLGGIRIPWNKGALGHSDGDALLHAIGDAILGVLGAGDIGDWFSDKDPKWKNIRSEKLLKTILEEARKRHWQVRHVDSVIMLERPKLGPYKNRMRKKVAGILSLVEGAVSVKAKTMEGLGVIGEGHAVACEAVVTMAKEAR